MNFGRSRGRRRPGQSRNAAARSVFYKPVDAVYALNVHATRITLPSFAKVNLHLEVAGRRPDGFHQICTVFQTISLADELSFRPADEITLSCDDPDLPAGPDNLVMKAADALRAHLGVNLGAAIGLKKRIPAPGGLGGGSSNAAAALIGLCRLWEVEPGTGLLHRIASGLGSDVPFFLEGGTAMGIGRGTDITPLDDIIESYMLVVTPDAVIPTAQVFERLAAPNLTPDASNRILQICRFEAESADFRDSALRNDLEPAAFGLFPEVAAAKQALLDLGARQALMSGSGASVFGLFDKEETRQAAMKALDAKVNWRKFAVATVSRSQYRTALGLVP